MNNLYTIGGPVQAGSGIYLERAADKELLDLCRQGIYAYLLAARQIGKSSLMVHTANQLSEEGVRTAIVDITLQGTQINQDTWYLGFLMTISRRLGLMFNISTWWESHSHISATQRLALFFDAIVLQRIQGQIVVFIDEIDSMLNLPFCSDFFVALRALFNERAVNPAFQRLSFVLLGVATPGELIQDLSRTPFNIGQRIELNDFTLTEAMHLAAGLGIFPANQLDVLRWILEWTEGHPYLTQRTCKAVAEQKFIQCTKQDVEKIITTSFFGERSERDNNLQFVRDMLLKRSGDRDAVLRAYRRIRLYYPVFPVENDRQSPTLPHLVLSGIVKTDEKDRLRVRNRIYKAVFNRNWINRNWSLQWWHALPMRVRIVAIIISILFIALNGATYFAFRNAAIAENQASIASTAQAIAVTERERAEKQALLNLSRQLSADALNRREDLDLALLLSLKSNAITNSVEARSSLFHILATNLYLIRMLHGHQDKVMSVALSPDGKRAAAAGFDGTVRLWDLETGDPIGAPLVMGSLPALSVAFSPDGRMLATSGGDALVVLWDIATGKMIGKPLEGHSNWIFSIAFNPDGSLLASAGADGHLILWEIPSGRMIGEPLHSHTDEVTTVVFSPDGELIATASRDKTIKLWEVETRTPTSPPLEGHSDWVWGLAFRPDGKVLASGSYDGTVMLWDVETGEMAGKVIRHPQGIITTIAFSSDGRRLASAGSDRLIRIWDMDNYQLLGDPLAGHQDEIRSLAFSPDGRRLLSGGFDSTILYWDLFGAQGVSEAFLGHTNRVSTLVVSSDNKWLISGSWDHTIRIWDTTSQRDIQKPLSVHQSQIEALALSPDNHWLASGDWNNQVILWDMNARLPVGAPLDGHTDFIESVAFSPDSETLASGGADGKIILWDINKQNPIIQFEDHLDGVESIAFSSDGRWLASGSYDGRIILRDLTSHPIITKTLTINNSWVHSIVFSPDNQLLASAHANGVIYLWDIGAEIPMSFPLRGHQGEVNSLAFSPDGKLLASGGRDNNVIVWDISNSSMFVQPLIGHEGWVWSVQFSQDGKRIFSAGDDQKIYVWNIDEMVWYQQACMIVNRNFTRSEWEYFIGSLLPYQPVCPISGSQ